MTELRADAARRAASQPRRQMVRVRRLRAARALPGRHPQGAPAHPRRRRPLRRQPHGPDRGARANSGELADAAAALERLVPVDIARARAGAAALCAPHRRRRRHPRRPDGRQPRRPPAARRQRRAQGRRPRASAGGAGRACAVEPLDRALLALQGPTAEAALASDRSRRRRRCASWTCARSTPAACRRSSCRAPDTPARTASRSRSRPSRGAGLRRARCCARPDVLPVGLGARDFAAARGRPLPLRPRHRRDDDAGRGGARMGDPAGAAPRRRPRRRLPRRRGDPRPDRPRRHPPPRRPPPRRPRADARGHRARRRRRGGAAVGAITSGGFGPSLDAPLAMGYVPIELAAPGHAAARPVARPGCCLRQWRKCPSSPRATSG